MSLRRLKGDEGEREREREAGGPSENESYRGEASERQTDRQTEIREFIKIHGDSEAEREGGWGGVNFFL